MSPTPEACLPQKHGGELMYGDEPGARYGEQQEDVA